MSRALLTSELSILIEAGTTSSRDALASQSVLRELHVSPHDTRRQQWFNTDFVIELAQRESREKSRVRGVPVRPYTLGGDFFVLLTSEGMPIRMELLEGESIPKSSFKEEVHRIDNAIRSLRTLPQHLSTRRVPYLRIARLSKSVAFLLCSTTAVSEVLSAKPVYIPSSWGLIEHRSAGGHILIDGVLVD